VTSEGVAAIQGGAQDMARDAALEDAQKRAVEQASEYSLTRRPGQSHQLISDGSVADQTTSNGTISWRDRKGTCCASTSRGMLPRPSTDDLELDPSAITGRTDHDLRANIGHEWYAGLSGQQTDIGSGKYLYRCVRKKALNSSTMMQPKKHQGHPAYKTRTLP
jgi:hypothetical protein